MPKFKIIRCGSFCDLVIAVTPANAGPDSKNARYYRFASWQIYDNQPETLNEIDRDLAITYFSGIADGIGFEFPPKRTFPSLEAVLKHIRKRRNRLYKKYNEKREKLLSSGK